MNKKLKRKKMCRNAEVFSLQINQMMTDSDTMEGGGGGDHYFVKIIIFY